MSAFAEFLAQIVQQQAAHNRQAQTTTRRAPNARLRESPVVPVGPDDMPVYRRPYAELEEDGSHPEGWNAIVARLQTGKQVPPAMVTGMQPHEILDAFVVGTTLRGDEPPQALPPRPTVQVSPDMVYTPAMGGEADPRYMPGSRSHPVERTYGKTDSIVQALATPEHPAGRYVAPMFEHPDGTAMSHRQAAQLISGQLAARRMRVLGAQDPSVGREYLDPLILDLTKSPTL